jgi:SAM-dependent methyltransferase
MTDEVVRALVFGGVAREYDRVRPHYPAQLFDDVLAYAGPLTAGGAVDVGAGTGRATLALASRGVPVTAVEPDPRMAAVLGEQAAGLPVTVHIGGFESFPAEGPFDLLTSAQAWHWVEPAARWERAGAILRPGGTVALFANQDRPADPAVAAELRAAHRPFPAQLLWQDELPVDESTMDWPEMAERPELTDYTTRLYRWRRRLTVVDYVANLATQSIYVMQDEAVRSALFADIRARLDGEITVDIDTELHLARRR